MSIVKAVIAKAAEIDNPPAAGSVTCHFNPENLRVSYSKPQPPEPTSGNNQPTTEASNVRLDVTLIFDTTEDRADVRSGPGGNNGTKVLKTLAEPNDGGASQSVTFKWGNFKFTGTIDTLTETLDYWSAEGVPLRSTVQLSIAGTDLDEIASTSVTVAKVSPPTNGWGTTEVARQAGDSAGTRKVNRDNEVEDPRFPALNDLNKKLEKANEDIDKAFEEMNAPFKEANEAMGELNKELGKLSIGGKDKQGNGFSLGTGGGKNGAGAGLSLGLSADVGIKASAGFKLGFSAGASVGFGFGASAGGGAGFGIGAGIGGGLGADIGFGVSAGLGEDGFSFKASASAGSKDDKKSGKNSASSDPMGFAAALEMRAAGGGMSAKTGYAGASGGSSSGSSASASVAIAAISLGSGGIGAPATIGVVGSTASSGGRSLAASNAGTAHSPARSNAARTGPALAPTPADSSRALASLPASMGAFAALGERREEPVLLSAAAVASDSALPATGPNTQFDLLGRATSASGGRISAVGAPSSVSAARAVRIGQD